MGRELYIQKCRAINRSAKARLDAIRAWDMYSPLLQDVVDITDSIESSLTEAPHSLDSLSYEPLREKLTLAEASINSIPDVAAPPTSTGPILSNTAGTAYYFLDYVDHAILCQPHESMLRSWGENAKKRHQKMLDREKDSQEVQRRLELISPRLADLYRLAVDTTTKCVAGLRTASDAAKDQRRVLEVFKGELLALCNPPQAKPSQIYEHISDCLAANSPITKKTVIDGKRHYDDLHDDSGLSGIMKGLRTATGEDMGRLLERINRHILDMTDSLDPALTGIAF